MTKIIQIKVSVGTNRIGSDVSDVIDVYIDDEMSEKEIEEAKEATARDWMFENIEWGWQDVD